MRLEAELYRGNKVVLPVAGALATATALAMFAAGTGPRLHTTAALFVLVTALSFLGLLRASRFAARRRKRRIGVDARGLSVDGSVLVPRQAILRARVEETEGAHEVVVVTHGLRAPLRIRVASARLAQALADALESAPQDVVELDALPPWAHRMRWLAMILTASPWILFNVLRQLPAAAILVVVGLYGVLALPLILPQKVTIGDDGVLLKWAGRRRFLPFASIVDARVTPLGVELDLATLRRVEIRLTHRATAEARRAAAVCDRIRAGIEAQRALAPADDEALLARGTRDDATWLADMTRLGTAEMGSYRSIALPRERLWAVLENPSADPSARAGAALALHARLDDDERQRLALVAQKTASPRLRVAVDAVAAAAPSDPSRIRVALAEVEAQELEVVPAIIPRREPGSRSG